MTFNHGDATQGYDELRAAYLALHAKAIALENEVKACRDELHDQAIYIEKLKTQVAALKRARYGKSSEKLDRQIEQLELMIEDAEENAAEAAARRAAAGLPPVPELESDEPELPLGARELPAHLPRELIELRACKCPDCGNGDLKEIGADVRELLDLAPAQFRVKVFSRARLICRKCEKIVQAPMPPLPVERGVASAATLAHVAVSKYGDHVPLNRQADIYRRSGIDISRKTMAGWIGQVAFLTEAVANAIGRHVKAGKVLHADDTPLPVLEKGRGRTKTGRMWIALRDERNWASGTPAAAYYRYAPDRTAASAAALLEGAEGFLHCDAYAGFNPMFETNPVTGSSRFREVACFAHARRKINDVYEAAKSPRALELLQEMTKLFEIEQRIKGRPAAERLAARQQFAVPRLVALKARMEDTLGQVSKKSELAKAILYTLTRWDAFTRYTADGRLEMTNNAAERSIRPVALGRDNYNFVGSDEGGKRAAILWTLIGTCKLNNIDPEAYLRTLLERIAGHKINEIDALLPWNLMAQH